MARAYLSDEFWKEISPIDLMLSFMVEFMDCKMSNWYQMSIVWYLSAVSVLVQVKPNLLRFRKCFFLLSSATFWMSFWYKTLTPFGGQILLWSSFKYLFQNATPNFLHYYDNTWQEFLNHKSEQLTRLSEVPVFFLKYRRCPNVHLPVVFWCEELPVVDQLQGVGLDPVPGLHPHLLQLLVLLHQMLDLRPLRQKVGLIPRLLDLFILSHLKNKMKNFKYFRI